MILHLIPSVCRLEERRSVPVHRSGLVHPTGLTQRSRVAYGRCARSTFVPRVDIERAELSLLRFGTQRGPRWRSAFSSDRRGALGSLPETGTQARHAFCVLLCSVFVVLVRPDPAGHRDGDCRLSALDGHARRSLGRSDDDLHRTTSSPAVLKNPRIAFTPTAWSSPTAWRILLMKILSKLDLLRAMRRVAIKDGRVDQ